MDRTNYFGTLGRDLAINRSTQHRRPLFTKSATTTETLNNIPHNIAIPSQSNPLSTKKNDKLI
ncbi:hypothetical protein [Burkholderia ubonensis]|uniref:hypothetical protein n=1 Tax=Burkholderia ubonensis TaxID=101571 RepID=UPI0012F7F26A|nr:hypothetical protein [Burkholderia ubonensis]